MAQAKAPNCARCGRKRQPKCRPATAAERSLAALGLASLAEHRLRVVLVPAPRPQYHGHRVRATESHDAAWYREFAGRRSLTHSLRRYTVNALREIAAGCVVQHHNATHAELLELLDRYDDLGPEGKASR